MRITKYSALPDICLGNTVVRVDGYLSAEGLNSYFVSREEFKRKGG